MRNPAWSRDELIVALDLYFRVNPLHTSKGNPDIIEASQLLNQLDIHLKAFVCTLATHYIDQERCYRLGPNFSFVQVIDTSAKPEASSKLSQCQYLQSSIQSFLKSAQRGSSYQMFYGSVADFQSSEDEQEFLDYLRGAVTQQPSRTTPL